VLTETRPKLEDVTGHDYVGALFGIAGAVLGLKKTESPDTGAYSYLFRANNRFD
jgi:hypothetical protein